MKHILKTCAAFFVATSLVFSLASCKSEDDDSNPVAVTSVELSDTTATITVGGTKTLTATVKPDNATDKTVTWTSDKTEVATVENGVVTAKKAGTATITATAGDKTATCAVTVSEVTYTVTVTSGTANPTTAAAGATVTITASDPAEGKVFDKWTTTSSVTFADETASSTTFIMPASAVTITATYKDAPAQTYAVTVTSGTANPTTAAAGATVTITASDPAEGKVFDKWTTETTGVTFADESASSTTFTMPASAVTITATYKDAPAQTYAVTVTSGTANPTTAAAGATVTITASDPAEGKVFDKWTTETTGVTFTDESTSPTTFTMPASAVTITATYKDAPTYSVTIAESTSGTVTASKTSGILQNETITLTVTPDSGYKLNTIGAKTGETDITITNNTFVMPAGNVTVTATFEAASYSITLNVNGGAYAESYSAPTSYTYGTGATLPTSENITKTNYAFGGWFASSDFSGDAVTAISTTDIGNKEYWAKWIPIYAVTVTNGTANPTTAAAGATVTITASDPAEGKLFDKWTTTSGVTFTDETASPTTFTMPASAVTVTATYKDAPKIVDLSTVTADTTVANGFTITGTLANNVKISIADGATVTLKNASINAEGTWTSGDYAGLTCLGDATITLEEESTNTVKGFNIAYPGIYVPVGKTLTINGSGALVASPNTTNAGMSATGAGIGGGVGLSCGNITIEGGTITATTANRAAAIGSGGNYTGTQTCGNITITGGTVTATCLAMYGAGIGAGIYGECGNISITGGTVTASGSQSSGGAGIGCGGTQSTVGTITIADTVTKVTAVKGYNAQSIGKGFSSGTCVCGTITIGGIVYNDGITESPYTYPKIVDLSTITEDTTIADGYTITGTLGGNYKITIADGATVTLKNVAITSLAEDATWAGINCPGNATLVIEGTNTVESGNKFINDWPAIFIAEGKTLTIQGTGSLTATGYGYGAGIGGGNSVNGGNIIINSGTIVAECKTNGAGIGAGGNACGDITINGGTITATGGSSRGAGIGGGGYNGSNCGNIVITGGSVTATGGGTSAGIGTGCYNNNSGNITISGGTIVATGGESAAGIGTGQAGKCGTITITDGVTSVTATKGENSPCSIGKGKWSSSEAASCGTVTIGGIVYNDGISTSPYVYPSATGHALTSAVIGEIVGTDGLAYAATDKDRLPAGVIAVGILGKVANGHGLILALEEAAWQTFSTIKGWTSNTSFGTTLKMLPNDAARGNLPSYTTLGSTTVSNWGVAQKSDYEAIFINFGSTVSDKDGTTYDYHVNNYLTTAGGTRLSDGADNDGNNGYWSATDENSGDGWSFKSSYWTGAQNSYSRKVRPVLAF